MIKGPVASWQVLGEPAAKLISMNAKKEDVFLDCVFHIQFENREALANVIADAGGMFVRVAPQFKTNKARFTPRDNPRLFGSSVTFRVVANSVEDMGLFFANKLSNGVAELLGSPLVELGGSAKPSIIPTFSAPKIKTTMLCCNSCNQPVADGPKFESLRINEVHRLGSRITELLLRKQSEMRDIEIRKLGADVVELGGFFDGSRINHTKFQVELNEVFARDWSEEKKAAWREERKSLAHQDVEFFLRVHAKEASRKQDADDLKSGKKTVEQLRKENSLISTKGKIREKK